MSKTVEMWWRRQNKGLPKISPSWSWHLWHKTSHGNGTADGRKWRTRRWNIILDYLGTPSGLKGSWQQRLLSQPGQSYQRGRCEGDLTCTAGLRGRGHSQRMQWPPAPGMALHWPTARTWDQSSSTARNLTCTKRKEPAPHIREIIRTDVGLLTCGV